MRDLRGGLFHATITLHATTILGGRLVGDAAETAVEVRERLEADIVGHFSDAGCGLHELALSLLDTSTIHEVGESQACRV